MTVTHAIAMHQKLCACRDDGHTCNCDASNNVRISGGGHACNCNVRACCDDGRTCTCDASSTRCLQYAHAEMTFARTLAMYLQLTEHSVRA